MSNAWVMGALATGLWISTLYLLIESFLWSKDKRLRRLTGHTKDQPKVVAPKQKQRSWLMNTAYRLVKRDEIEAVLIQAGHPWNLTFDKFMALKVVFTLGMVFVTVTSRYEGVAGILVPVGAAIVSWFGLDAILRARRDARNKLIFRALPPVLDTLASQLAGGIPLNVALAEIYQAADDPLKEELMHLGAEYGLTANLTEATNSLMSRVSLLEVELFCMALKQYEDTGRAKAQLLMLSNSIKAGTSYGRQTRQQNMNTVMTIVIGLLVLCLITLIGVPLFFITVRGLTAIA